MKNYNFDEALQALNDINEKLSAGNLTLEKTLELFAQDIKEYFFSHVVKLEVEAPLIARSRKAASFP